MILGERCHDPFFRQSVRVSMGAIFRMPLVRSLHIREDLKSLQRAGIQLLATVLDEAAEDLSKAARPNRIAMLFGNEAQGLDHDIVDMCDRRVTIPMKLETDSLNVAVAAAISLFHFTNQNCS
jgi:tRNA G18 (ribose-2'-O)-methylase SpoU